jgi:hypothetical protein
MKFVPRNEKAKWGLACNQSADGRLWAGKGYERPLGGQFPDEAEAVRQALEQTRGNRNGRFFVDFENRKVTMYVDENRTEQADF